MKHCTNQVIPLVLVFLSSTSTQAQIRFTQGFWESSFACSDWDMTGVECHARSEPLVCDGIAPGTCGENSDQYSVGIGLEANYPGGGGGAGLYRLVGDGNTTGQTGPTGSGMWLDFPNTTEIWVRWYFRFESGMPCTGSSGFSQHKLLYIMGVDDACYLDEQNPGFSLYDHTSRHTGDYGFDDFYGGEYGDGSWHAVEFHFSTGDNLFEYWVYPAGVDNPIPAFRSNTVSWRFTTLDFFKFPSNVKTDFSGAADGRVFRIYYDDIALSTQGRIGALDCTSCGRDAGMSADASKVDAQFLDNRVVDSNTADILFPDSHVDDANINDANINDANINDANINDAINDAHRVDSQGIDVLASDAHMPDTQIPDTQRSETPGADVPAIDGTVLDSQSSDTTTVNDGTPNDTTPVTNDCSCAAAQWRAQPGLVLTILLLWIRRRQASRTA